MRTAIASFCVSALIATTLASAAGAPPTPPIKTGLWEVKMVRDGDDGKQQAEMAKAQAAMANMPPEIREKMQAMMKSRGVDMSAGNGIIRTCVNKESLDRGQWQSMAAASGCTTSYSANSASSWKWHSSCPSMKIESDGEAIFTSPESYTVKIASTSSMMGKPTATNMTQTAKWVGADCGDLKPVTAAGMK